MIFIDVCLLLAHTAKYLTYLLTLRYVLKVDNLHMTQCAKIIVGFMANIGGNILFIKRLQTFFFLISIYVFNVLFIFF